MKGISVPLLFLTEFYVPVKVEIFEISSKKYFPVKISTFVVYWNSFLSKMRIRCWEKLEKTERESPSPEFEMVVKIWPESLRDA